MERTKFVAPLIIQLSLIIIVLHWVLNPLNPWDFGYGVIILYRSLLYILSIALLLPILFIRNLEDTTNYYVVIGAIYFVLSLLIAVFRPDPALFGFSLFSSVYERALFELLSYLLLVLVINPIIMYINYIFLEHDLYMNKYYKAEEDAKKKRLKDIAQRQRTR